MNLTYEVMVYSYLCSQKELHHCHLLKFFISVEHDEIILMWISFSLQHRMWCHIFCIPPLLYNTLA